MKRPRPLLSPHGALQAALLLLAGSHSAPVAASPEYTHQLKPLFQERCLSCHGALQQKAGLRLDTVALMLQGGDSGPVLTPGRPEASLLFQRVTADDPEDRMPPEHEAPPFSADQVEALRAWIAGGAPAPADEAPEADPRDHWAFRPVRRPPVPSLPAGVSGPVRNPVDAFIATRQLELGLVPQPTATRAMLVRRLYLDLVGLPPTPEAIERHLTDPAPDWYERLVTALLDDPRHGERWARHWMDIWRYSDAWGLGDQHRNSQKHIWHWRDWIVEAVNRDLPYDEMIRQMLAADELHPEDPDALRATGFLARNFFLFNRNQWLDETVEHVGKALLGLTLNCSKCHDHKYDPLPQTDYYAMRAFFEPYHARLDLLPGEPLPGRNALPRVYDREPETPTYRFIRGSEAHPDTSRVMEPGIPAVLGIPLPPVTPVTLPPAAWEPERRPGVLETHIAAARTRLDEAQAAAGAARARAAGESDPDKAPVLQAGVALAEARQTLAEAALASVEARVDALHAAWAEAPEADSLRVRAVRAGRDEECERLRLKVRELELKRLEASAEGTAGIEEQLAGAQAALAGAEERFGEPVGPGESPARLTGAVWVATRFLDSSRDDPAREFPRTSTGRRTALAHWVTDPRNPLTPRVAVNHLWNRHFGAPLVATVFDFGRKGVPPTHPELLDWLAVEWIESGWSLKHLHRLLVLSETYRRGSGTDGSEVALERDPENRSWWRRPPLRVEAQVVRDTLLAHAGLLDSAVGGPPIPMEQQDASSRRSLYFLHSNNDRNLFLSTFDDALVLECYQRERSVVPQQALALLNSRLVHRSALPIAGRFGERAGSCDITFVQVAFRSLLGFDPDDAEVAACLAALEAWHADPGAVPGHPPRSQLVWALLNHTDFITLR